MSTDITAQPSDVAILSMTGRFPGAGSPEDLLDLLQAGRETISFFSEEELLGRGISPDTLRNARYVKAKGMLPAAEWFDAELFGFTPREAAMTAPDHRLLLECAAEALERGGYDPLRHRGRIGLFAGCGVNYYLINHVLADPRAVEEGGEFAAVIANDKDHLCTRIAYKLNLTGPAVTVQTACSTSLVAVHLACQSLISGECDMALAGGASVALPFDQGYWYQEEGTRSPDGHCRPFDARAAGTVTSSGAAVVLLKRLGDALADRDAVEAVIKGSAINNDGSRRVAYTAPGVQGQATVIAEALAVAGVTADTIGFVEGHGTGTLLGDPIEVAALSSAFRRTTDRRQFCALGSIKGNLGHLDAAAGATGLIKAALAVRNGQIPPTAHFSSPNPAIDFAASPFFVNGEPAGWPLPEPRRAGVSSFGIGGTNAHVVLEQPPARAAADPVRRPYLVLPLSARSAPALGHVSRDLAQHLRETPPDAFADIAYTLAVGRRERRYRSAVVCADAVAAVADLERIAGDTAVLPVDEAPLVVFMYPGQGTQYVGVGEDTYSREPVYRDAIDRCAGLLGRALGADVRELMYGEGAADRIDETAVAQAVLFVTQYAATQLLASWGVRPAVVLGHSIGEYAAACAAEIFSLEDALRVVVARGRLMQAAPGAMIAVNASERDLAACLPADLTIAAVNAPAWCAVSGAADAITRWTAQARARGLHIHTLAISSACHSAALDSILDAFAREVQMVELRPPTVPIASTVFGRVLRAEEAVQAQYWVRQIREPVRFMDAITPYARDSHHLLVEIGPGRALTAMAGLAVPCARAAVSLIPAAKERVSAGERAARALGDLWSAGVPVDWDGVYGGERRRRVRVPLTPQERRRCWIDRPPRRVQQAAVERQPERALDARTGAMAQQVDVMRAQLRALRAGV